MKRKNIINIFIGTGLILLVPVIAMMFSESVDWKIGDFIVIGALLIGAGLLYEYLTTKINPKRRGTIAVIIVAAVLLIWVELAVGIFNSPFAGS